MRAAHNFQSGMAMVRQLEFALFDMLLSTRRSTRRRARIAAVGAGRGPSARSPSPPAAAYDRVHRLVRPFFAGGYAAGYYSYKWAEVLSADAYSLFEEAGVLSPAAGARFRDEVLARGGSRPAMESFVAFRGPGLHNSTRFCGIMA